MTTDQPAHEIPDSPQGIQAIIQWQQGVPTKRHDDGLVLDGKHGGSRLLRPCRQVVDGAALSPLGDGLLVDAVAPS